MRDTVQREWDKAMTNLREEQETLILRNLGFGDKSTIYNVSLARFI